MSLYFFESVVLVLLHQQFSLSCYTAEHRSAEYFLLPVHKFYWGLIFFRNENFMICCCLKQNYKTRYSYYTTKMEHHESLCKLGSTYSTTSSEFFSFSVSFSRHWRPRLTIHLYKIYYSGLGL
jgi:hypothetical protein